MAYDEQLTERFRKATHGLGDLPEKRMPAGYAKDHPAADLLLYKGFSAWLDHADPSTATDPAIMRICRDEFSRLKPVFDWLSD
ncbi:MAG: DUF2461 family protein [Geminicoccaceae bacterium]